MVFMRSSMSSSMLTFAIKERVDGFSEDVVEVSRVTTFLLDGKNRMETSLLDGTTGTTKGAIEGEAE